MNKSDEIKELAVLATEADIQYTLNGVADEDFCDLIKTRTKLHAAIDAQQAEIDRLTKDAERYRWLERDAYECVIPHGNTIFGSRTGWVSHIHPGATFAEAVDKAMADPQARGDKT